MNWAQLSSTSLPLGLFLFGCSPAAPSRAPAPEPAGADQQPDEPNEPRARDCNPSTFEETADGFVWRVGGAAIPFRTTEKRGERAYNYARRSVRVEAVGQDDVAVQASCYTETDCGAPDDPKGKDLWCLVSHGLEGSAALFDLFAAHNPCGSTLDMIDEFIVRSTSPTCLRSALGTYPGALYDDLGWLSEDMASAGVPAEVIAAIEKLAKAAADADQGDGDPQGRTKSAAALRELRETIAPHVGTKAGWQLDLLAQRALARLENRYRYTVVGPEETLYDVISSDVDPWQLAPTVAPWLGRRVDP